MYRQQPLEPIIERLQFEILTSEETWQRAVHKKHLLNRYRRSDTAKRLKLRESIRPYLFLYKKSVVQPLADHRRTSTPAQWPVRRSADGGNNRSSAHRTQALPAYQRPVRRTGSLRCRKNAAGAESAV